MGDIIARCGYRCNLCLAYKDNIKSEQDRRKFRDGVFRYYSDRLTLDECYCDGCLTDDSENPKLIDTECRVRPCVIEKGLDNCAYCGQYPCKELEPKMIEYQKVERRFGAPIPKEAYECFIKPYESREVLDEIKQK
ncbi:hypothetical protein ES703_85725 [subsurface metagenome]